MVSSALGCEARSSRKDFKPESSGPEEILFRKFIADGKDQEQMAELVFSNAFLGEPFDVICPCKEWFAGVVLTPYIEHQPENIHLAIHRPTGRLVGYLTGSLGGHQFEKAQYNMVRSKVVSLAVSLTLPWTLFDYSSRQFATYVIFKGERERPGHPDSGVHWHFQVHKDFRGQGIGSRLLRRFVRDAIKADFQLIWAEVTSYPEKPPQYFEDRGWSIYDAKPTRLFGDHVDFPVETLCITKPLAKFQASKHAA